MMAKLLSRALVMARAWVICLGLSQPAVACAFHGYTPDPTVVDVLLGSEHVVLARPDPSNPNRFAPVAVLIGPTGDIDVPAPVDSQTWSRLRQAPNDAVLFARDGAYGPWLRLATLDAEYRAVIDVVVARQNNWSLGNDEDRYQLFADQLTAQNPELRRLALLELDRADYSLLRDLRLPKMPGLRQDLKAGDDDLLPIRVLLAGLSGDGRNAPALQAGLQAAAGNDAAYLGAYATALIELHGVGAVQVLMQDYLTATDQTAANREKILEAFAIHAQVGTKPTRRAIRREVAQLLTQSPSMAGAIARQFGYRSDWSFAKPLKAAISQHPPAEIADIFAINQYIGIAARTGGANE